MVICEIKATCVLFFLCVGYFKPGLCEIAEKKEHCEREKLGRVSFYFLTYFRVHTMSSCIKISLYTYIELGGLL
jgi:hypothetical protein